PCPEPSAWSSSRAWALRCGSSRVVIFPPPVLVTFPAPVITSCPTESVVGALGGPQGGDGTSCGAQIPISAPK
ncbi:KRSC protein, partial [Zosterops hypoxanthus]|nr:KRSC protein [Zosterops hypoxanthus]